MHLPLSRPEAPPPVSVCDLLLSGRDCEDMESREHDRGVCVCGGGGVAVHCCVRYPEILSLDVGHN